MATGVHLDNHDDNDEALLSLLEEDADTRADAGWDAVCRLVPACFSSCSYEASVAVSTAVAAPAATLGAVVWSILVALSSDAAEFSEAAKPSEVSDGVHSACNTVNTSSCSPQLPPQSSPPQMRPPLPPPPFRPAQFPTRVVAAARAVAASRGCSARELLLFSAERMDSLARDAAVAADALLLHDDDHDKDDDDRPDDVASLVRSVLRNAASWAIFAEMHGIGLLFAATDAITDDMMRKNTLTALYNLALRSVDFLLLKDLCQHIDGAPRQTGFFELALRGRDFQFNLHTKEGGQDGSNARWAPSWIPGILSPEFHLSLTAAIVARVGSLPGASDLTKRLACDALNGAVLTVPPDSLTTNDILPIKGVPDSSAPRLAEALE
ncbi:hypothetical protein HK405_007363, partial [Cladochytrium tenue]